MNYDKIMEIHWKCHMRARRQQCVDSEYLMDFAKMVAKECMQLCKEVEEDLELVPNKNEREAAVAGVMFCYDAIKGEFGVEE